MPTTTPDGRSCGEPDCEDGYVFYPPLQDGAQGFCRACQRCEQNWRRYHSTHPEAPEA